MIWLSDSFDPIGVAVTKIGLPLVDRTPLALNVWTTGSIQACFSLL